MILKLSRCVIKVLAGDPYGSFRGALEGLSSRRASAVNVMIRESRETALRRLPMKTSPSSSRAHHRSSVFPSMIHRSSAVWTFAA